MDILFGFTALAFVFKVAHIHQLADELNKYDKCETGIYAKKRLRQCIRVLLCIYCVYGGIDSTLALDEDGMNGISGWHEHLP